MNQNEYEILALKRMAAVNFYTYAQKAISDLGFTPRGDYNETYEMNKAICFEKQAEGSIHQVLLEDHRYYEDIKDWVIFSELKDDETDWFGRKINSPYPLTLSELTAFGTFIKAFQNYKEVVNKIKAEGWNCNHDFVLDFDFNKEVTNEIRLDFKIDD